MNPSHAQALNEQLRQFRAQHRALLDGPHAELARAAFDPEQPDWCDPELVDALDYLFSRTPEGKLEALRIELDLHRRVAASRRAEALPRPYGVIEFVCPVLQDGNVVHLLRSGPVKIDSWMPRERETLQRITGVPEARFPSGLLSCSTYREPQAQVLAAQLARRARLLEAALASPSAAPMLPQVGAQDDLLASGLPEHLDLLLGNILAHAERASHTTTGAVPHDLTRITATAQRARSLVQHLLQLQHDEARHPQAVDVHALLGAVVQELETRMEHVRFHLKATAAQHVVTAAPSALRHLVYTLLAGVADGLGAHGGFLGIRTRNHLQDGRDVLHIELRDGGGEATFAGTEPHYPQQTQEEQKEAAQLFSDWYQLAERLDASVQVTYEPPAVTRADVILPLHSVRPTLPEKRPQVWIVEDRAAATHTTADMLDPEQVDVTALPSGQALQEHLPLADSPPDLVIISYTLPDTRGSELRTWLYLQDPEIPVLLISGMAATHPGIASATALRRTMFLQKPFDAQELRNLLHLALCETLPTTD